MACQLHQLLAPPRPAENQVSLFWLQHRHSGPHSPVPMSVGPADITQAGWQASTMGSPGLQLHTDPQWGTHLWGSPEPSGSPEPAHTQAALHEPGLVQCRGSAGTSALTYIPYTAATPVGGESLKSSHSSWSLPPHQTPPHTTLYCR